MPARNFHTDYVTAKADHQHILVRAHKVDEISRPICELRAKSPQYPARCGPVMLAPSKGRLWSTLRRFIHRSPPIEGTEAKKSGWMLVINPGQIGRANGDDR